MIKHTFDKIYSKIISQQKLFVQKHEIISEGWFGSLKEIGNVIGGAGETLAGLGKGDLKAAGKGLWKTISAPIGAITELGQPSAEDLQKQYEASKKADFENEALKKAYDSIKETYKDNEKVVDAFTDWSEGGRTFVSELKIEDEKEKAEALRKILAIRKFKADAKEAVQKIEAPQKKEQKKEQEQNLEQTDQKDTDKEAKLADDFRDAFENAFGTKLTEKIFDKRFEKGFVCIPNSNGKGFQRLKFEQAKKDPEKYLKIAQDRSAKAKEARAKKDEDGDKKQGSTKLNPEKIEKLKKKVKPIENKSAEGHVVGNVLMKNEGESDADYKERYEVLKKAKPDLLSVLDPENKKQADMVAQLAKAMGN